MDQEEIDLIFDLFSINPEATSISKMIKKHFQSLVNNDKFYELPAHSIVE